MAKKDISYNIEEIIEVLGERESNDWAKVLSKITWNDGVPQIDIRNMNLANLQGNNEGKILFGKGITLTDIEVERMIKALLREGYLDDNEILAILEERNDIFKVPKKMKKMIIRHMR